MMATESCVRLQHLLLILTVLHRCWSLEVSTPVKQYEASRGDDVILTCAFKPANREITNLVLTWHVYSKNPTEPLKTVATKFLNTPADISPAYEGRAVLDVDITRLESTLQIKRVTLDDSRTYQCNVLIPNDDEGTTLATTNLLVLVPPTPPICDIEGSAEYWNDITLTCRSEEASPDPVYQWKTYNVDYRPRPFPPKTIEKDGRLSLVNISRETSGFFTCTSTNRIGSASCNVTLAVMPPSSNMGATVGIIAGVAAGLLGLGLIVYCCRKKRGKKEKKTESSPTEMAYHDRETLESGQYVDDAKRKDEEEALDTGENHRYRDKQDDGSDRPDEQRKEKSDSRGSRDRLDENRERSSGSRDRLDDNRERYGGSRDRLDENRERYGGSRDRLDENRERYGGSRDRLDDNRERYGGSRDRLDDNRERYGGSRDRLDENRERYGGSRDRLDDNRERYGGSRDRLDDQRANGRGSRDRLDERYDNYEGEGDH